MNDPTRTKNNKTTKDKDQRKVITAKKSSQNRSCLVWEWFSPCPSGVLGCCEVFNPHHTYDWSYRTAKSMEGMSLHPEDIENQRTGLQDYRETGLLN